MRRERGLALMADAPAVDRVRDVSGGGGLYTTVGDYGRFAQALLDGGGPILGARSTAEMTTNQIGGLATVFRIRYGLSVGAATVDAPGASPLPVSGFGWYGVYSTWFWALPAQRTAMLLFCNVLEPGMNLGLVSDVARAAGL